MELGTFTKKNEGFLCEHCGLNVPPAEKTCRNHCPRCLHSKHVDINPGDRANPCRGLLRPVSYEISGKKGLVLCFICQKCGSKTKNISLRDDALFPDDYDSILRLSAKP